MLGFLFRSHPRYLHGLKSGCENLGFLHQSREVTTEFIAVVSSRAEVEGFNKVVNATLEGENFLNNPGISLLEAVELSFFGALNLVGDELFKEAEAVISGRLLIACDD